MRNRWWFVLLGCVIIACSSPSVHTASVVATPPPAPPSPPPRPTPISATATLRDFVGAKIGTVTFDDTRAGVLISGTVTGLGIGAHGIHIHEFGQCSPPFTSAGEHFNPAKKRHGFKNPNGPHAGDLPNLDMPAAGTLKFQFLMAGATLKGPQGLLGPSGASIVIHMTGDDLATDPAGNSGGRQACGVIVRVTN